METPKVSSQVNVRKIKVWVKFRSNPFIMDDITFHRHVSEKWEDSEIVECTLLVPLPKEKVIENLLKRD